MASSRSSVPRTGPFAHRLDDAVFTVIDLETLGIRAAPGTIIEVGACRLKNGRVIGAFETLVRPWAPIPHFVQRLTSITDSMVASAPSPDQVIPQLRRFIARSVVVAHNARFDRSFLDAEFERLYGSRLKNPILCTMQMARRLFPGLGRYNLDSLTAHFGLRCERRHRALDDALATAQLLAILLDRAHATGASRVADLASL